MAIKVCSVLHSWYGCTADLAGGLQGHDGSRVCEETQEMERQASGSLHVSVPEFDSEHSSWYKTAQDRHAVACGLVKGPC